MFNAYLTYEQLNEYLNELLDKELLAYDLHTRTYHIAPKGSKFLELYSELGKGTACPRMNFSVSL